MSRAFIYLLVKTIDETEFTPLKDDISLLSDYLLGLVSAEKIIYKKV